MDNKYPLLWFNIEEWVGNFTVDDTNVTDIENDHKVVYGLKLPVGYYSSPTELEKNHSNVSRQHAVRFEGVHKSHI